jgi:hypothetical protein
MAAKTVVTQGKGASIPEAIEDLRLKVTPSADEKPVPVAEPNKEPEDPKAGWEIISLNLRMEPALLVKLRAMAGISETEVEDVACWLLTEILSECRVSIEYPACRDDYTEDFFDEYVESHRKKSA